MGGCQNYGPLLGPVNTRCRIILRTQKGSIKLTTAHMRFDQSPTQTCFGMQVGIHVLVLKPHEAALLPGIMSWTLGVV